MAFNRDDRSGGSRSGFQSRGRSSFGGGRSFDRGNDRGGFQPRGRSSFGGDRGDRQMFKAVCDNCGKECEVPFRPTTGKPVYCSDCFEKMGGKNSDGRSERTDFRAPTPRVDLSIAQFDSLNVKLDKIIKLLEPKVVEEIAEIKAPKVKKEKKVASEK